MLDILRTVQRRRRDAEPLRAPRHGWVVDRLDIDPVLFNQQVGDLFAQDGIANQHRHDVARIGLMGHAFLIKPPAQMGHGTPLAFPFRVARLQMANAGKRTSHDRRRQ